MIFPQVRGRNLEHQEFSLPDDLAGELRLVFIAFRQLQQIEVNSWVPQAEELAQRHSGLRYYELPTLATGYRLARGFIDGGMRAGIPDPATRQRTITLYLDKAAFRRALAIDSEDQIVTLLMDAQGQELWRTEGEWTLEKGRALEEVIAQRTQSA